MKQTGKKLTSLLLALAMVIGLMPVMTVTAAATESSAVSVQINGSVTLNAEKPYYVNGKATARGTLGTGGCTAEFNATARALTLKGYNGGSIFASGTTAAAVSLTVVVDGNNTIHAQNGAGIECCYGSLTVQGKTGGKTADKLTVVSGDGGISTALGNLTISDLAELNVSSTATGNNGVKSDGALTLENIGSARISLPNAGAGCAALLGQTSVTISSVDDLEVNSGGNGIYSGSSASGNITISATKVMLYSKAGNPICNYGGNVSVNAGTVIAVTNNHTAIQAMKFSNTGAESTVNVTATSGLYIKGAVVQSSGNPTVKLNEKDIPMADGIYTGTPEGVKTETVAITIDEDEKTQSYSGHPVIIAVRSSVDGLTYIYDWYDASGNLLGGSAPVDAGTYGLRVYAFGLKERVAYTGDTGTEPIEITIQKAPAPNEWKTANANITSGNNLITLPEIPGGMSFGTPSAVTRSGDEGSYTYTEDNGIPLTLTLSGNQLSIQASALSADTYYVKVPVIESSKSNYVGYDIILTLTKQTNQAIFDRCDGSEPSLVTISAETNQATLTLPDTTLYSKGNTDGAWQAAIGNALMYGYEFAGWYTAPNGWGTQISDKNGNLLNGQSFSAGTTYYARWIWTCAYVSYDPEDWSAIYGVLQTPRTVYTTCLDFTNATQLRSHVAGDGYKWENNTLTLDGAHIQALDSVCGMILPEGSNIEVVSLKNNSYEKFYKEGNQYNTTDKYKGYNATSNIISCGSVDATAAVFCKGGLTIQQIDSNSAENQVGLGNSLYADKGGIRTLGELTIKKANIHTAFLRAALDMTIKDSLVFATEYADKFTGKQYVRSETGSITIDQSYVFTDQLQAKQNLSITGRESRVWVDFLTSAGDTISISDSGYKTQRNGTYNYALNFGESESSIWGLFAQDIRISNSILNSASIMTGDKLTISNGSEVNVRPSESMLPVMLFGESSISDSTVNVTEVKPDSVGIYDIGCLAINRSTVTVSAASGAEPFAAIVVYGGKNDRGLVLNSSAVTIPAGNGIIHQQLPSESGEEPEYVWSIAGDGSYAKTLTIVPVVYTGGSDDSDDSDTTSKDNTSKDVESEPAGPSYEGFDDLAEDAWYHDGISYVLESGLMNGVGDGRFAPDETTSRSMVATILWRLAGSPQTGEGHAFTDVASGIWYSDAVSWAAENGIANGYGGAFDPSGSITREQLACMLYRYAGTQGRGFSGDWMMQLPYADSDSVSDWAYEAICWCTANGIMNGKGGNRLDPAGLATRAETAAMLQRFADNIK